MKKLTDFSTRIEKPAYWEDLVVPNNVLQQLYEIVHEIKNESYLKKDRNVTRPSVRSGTQVLFHSEPGNGKALAASALASELQMDLYGIDYTAVLSRHAIETAKNLQQLFDTVEENNVLLLMDNVEIVFGMQSDSLKNLLDMVKMHGNLIFTTTKKSEIDKKLLDLVSHIVKFPFPDDMLREQIWIRSVPYSIPMASNVNFKALAEQSQQDHHQAERICLH